MKTLNFLITSPMTAVRKSLEAFAIPSIRTNGFLPLRNSYKILLAALTFLSFCVGAFAQIAPYSADYYTINAEENVGKSASVYVYYARYVPSQKSPKDGYKVVNVGTKSGYINVLVPDGQLKSFLSRFSGDFYQPKGMITGKFLKLENQHGYMNYNPYCIELN